ncbi:MAG: cell surface protein SprA, partial [Muribaculaceae bacterium]|nr:cell surface protein SprA [Muribaculaceae bacterium]
SSTENFTLSPQKFDVKTKRPMPWDPANFTINFSFSRQKKSDPTTEYENTNDYRGSLAYSYSPYIKGFKPFSFISSTNKNVKFVKDWELRWLPDNISFLTTMSRYYYEQQTRSETDQMFQLPVSVSKNFLWDRQLNLTWNLTSSISLTFNSNTSARIEETAGAVNRKLFPDKYKEWQDTVWSSILSMGTPWSYNQSFVASYKAPFNRIPVLDFLTANASYNATYRWDRGATIDEISMGNTIANQATLSADGRVNFESLYNKIPYVKDVHKRFSATRAKSSSNNKSKKPKRFERTFKLKSDTTTLIKHNLRVPKVNVTATTTDGTPFPVRFKIVDANSVEVLDHGDQNLKFTIVEVQKVDKPVFKEILAYTTRLIISPRTASVRWKRARGLTLPLFRNDVGNIFGQSNAYGPMSPGLDFAFGFTDESYVTRAKERGWLITNYGQTSPALISATDELNVELNLEPINGLKIQLTMNRTDNRSKQMQFMYADMPVSLTGSYTRTHCAIGTALSSSKADNGYASDAFDAFLRNIPIVAKRIEDSYMGVNYPDAGFLSDTPWAGQPFDPAVGTSSVTSSDVLIPAFLAAYSGSDPSKITLDLFPSFKSVLPNWRITYDALQILPNSKSLFKTFSLNHAYQCTYSVGNYSSFLNWISADGNRGFTLDELTGRPIPSSPYNITTVAITERFAPLIGASVTLRNDITFNAEYRDQRTLTLNPGAGQVVEATTKGLTVGAGYKIVGFNTILKMKGSGKSVSNDLTLNLDLNFNSTQALIRRIETAYTQPTSGTETFGINFSAKYILSRRLTLAAYFDHQVNTPLVTTSAYPTTNTSYGLSLNLNLAR